jgi:hypothetical protein
MNSELQSLTREGEQNIINLIEASEALIKNARRSTQMQKHARLIQYAKTGGPRNA